MPSDCNHLVATVKPYEARSGIDTEAHSLQRPVPHFRFNGTVTLTYVTIEHREGQIYHVLCDTPAPASTVVVLPSRSSSAPA